MSGKKTYRILISGGGSGGHVFPAIAIADAIKKIAPDTVFKFVGAKGKIEMTKVPEAGYEITGLNIAGLQRRLTLKNLSFPFKLISSLVKSQFLVSRFKPDIAIGVGGYASGPVCYIAKKQNKPIIVQEQNSYPGITNKLLGPKASRIFVAYDNMDRFFPKDRIVNLGNPVRKEIIHPVSDKSPLTRLGLDPNKKTILVIGGSLGAGTINKAIELGLDNLSKEDIQLVWQCGARYFENLSHLNEKFGGRMVVQPFIKNMAEAYGMADLIISRAGAISVSELCIQGKPVVFVPSPFVSEDHQNKNAKALEDVDAAIRIEDKNVNEQLWPTVISLFKDDERQAVLGDNIKKLAKPNAADEIAKEILKFIDAR